MVFFQGTTAIIIDDTIVSEAKHSSAIESVSQNFDSDPSSKVRT